MKQTVTIRNPRHLSLSDNRLIIREKDPKSCIDTMLAQIPLSDIWVVIIDSPQITMTSALVSEMNDAGIGLMYCGRDHMPNGLCLPLGAHSRHAEIVEHQLAIPKPLRNQLWKKIVVSKILNQARALELAGGDAAVVAKVRAMPPRCTATTGRTGRRPRLPTTSPRCFRMEREGKGPWPPHSITATPL